MGLDKVVVMAGASIVFASSLLDINNATMMSELYSWLMIPIKTAVGVLLAWAMNKWIIRPMELAGGWKPWFRNVFKKKTSDDSGESPSK